jgi:uncharacterized RDD family membrane protein YckC
MMNTMDNLIIDTPEQIPLEFPLAGIGSRFLALALDTLFQIAAWLVLFGIAAAMGARGSKMPTKGAWTLAVVVLGAFLLQSGYFALFEAIWNGQTPGKRLTRLRVIQDSGRPITAYEAVARNLLRIVDSIPALYGVGIISALLSTKSKRLGDYVAGTVVVHEKPAVLETGGRWDLAAASGTSSYDVSRLTPEEFQLIEAFLLRRNQLALRVRAETVGKIINRLSGRLAFSADDARNPEALLENLATAYRTRARYG